MSSCTVCLPTVQCSLLSKHALFVLTNFTKNAVLKLDIETGFKGVKIIESIRNEGLKAYKHEFANILYFTSALFMNKLLHKRFF